MFVFLISNSLTGFVVQSSPMCFSHGQYLACNAPGIVRSAYGMMSNTNGICARCAQSIAQCAQLMGAMRAALCAMRTAWCAMRTARCAVCIAPVHNVHNVLRAQCAQHGVQCYCAHRARMQCALRIVPCALRTMLCAFRAMPCALRTMLHALCPYIVRTAQHIVHIAHIYNAHCAQ